MPSRTSTNWTESRKKNEKPISKPQRNETAKLIIYNENAWRKTTMSTSELFIHFGQNRNTWTVFLFILFYFIFCVRCGFSLYHIHFIIVIYVSLNWAERMRECRWTRICGFKIHFEHVKYDIIIMDSVLKSVFRKIYENFHQTYSCCGRAIIS